jgi:hypothetical protein
VASVRCRRRNIGTAPERIFATRPFGAAAQPPMFFREYLQIVLHVFQTQQLFLQPRDMRFRLLAIPRPSRAQYID